MRDMYRLLLGPIAVSTRAGLRRLMRLSPRGCGHFGAVLLTGLVGMAGLGTCSNPFSDQARDEIAASSLDAASLLPELVVDLDDHLSDGQVSELAQRYGARFVPDSSYVLRDRIYRVKLHSVGEQ